MRTDLTGQILDTRDLIERRAEIESELEDESLLEEGEAADLKEELDEIDTIESEIPEYQYGEAMIREDYFTDYAQELAEDIGAISRDAGWPLSCINWDEAADELKADYIEVEWQGHTYLARA